MLQGTPRFKSVCSRIRTDFLNVVQAGRLERRYFLIPSRIILKMLLVSKFRMKTCQKLEIFCVK